MIGVLMLGLKLAGLLFAAALLLRLIIPEKNTARRCPRCRYEMEGVPGLRCPECGKEHKRERKLLYKPRRKRAFALVALLLLIAYGGHLGGRAVDDGWTTIIPSTALVVGYAKIDANATKGRNYPMSPALQRYYASIGRPYYVPQNQQNPWDSLWIELLKRADPETGTLRQWQRRWLIDRAIEQGFQGSMVIRAAGGWPALNNTQRHQYMDTIADRLFQPRSLTPIGSPMFARMIVTPTLRNEHYILKARFQDNEWFIMNHDPDDRRNSYLAISGSRSNRSVLNLGNANESSDQVEMELELSDTRHDFKWSGKIKLNARVEGSLDQALPAHRAENIDSWLAIWASTGLALTYENKNAPGEPIESQLVLKDNGRSEQLRQYTQSQYIPMSAYDIVIDTDQELLAGDTVIGRGRCLWVHQQGSDPTQAPPRKLYSDPIVLDESRFHEAIKNNERLTVRVVSTSSDRTLRALYAKHRWDGSITAPLGPTWAHNATPSQHDPK